MVSGAVLAAAPHLKNAAASSKKDSSFMSLLKGGVRLAADLAPAILPFLLASHGPTKALAAANPSSFAGVAAGAPLAVSGGTTSQLTGLRGIRVSGRDAHGAVNRVVVTTVDLISALSSGSGLAAGDVLTLNYVSPLDPAYQGTKFADYGLQYERWKVLRAAFVYEPVCPATTAGALTGCVFNDPAVSLGSRGIELLRSAGSQDGADTFQVWSAGCWSVPVPEAHEFFFTDPDGSDIRLTAAGLLTVVAASPIDASLDLGNLFLFCESEYMIPSLVDSAPAGLGCRLTGSTFGTVNNATTYQPVTALSTDIQILGGGAFELASTFVDDIGTSVTSGNCLVGLSAGDWAVFLRVRGDTAALADLQIGLTQEALAAGAAELQAPIAAADIAKVIGDWSFNFITVHIPAVPSPGMPMVWFTASGAVNCVIGGAVIYAFLIDERIWTSDPAPQFLDRRRRREFYSQTMQGRQEAMFQNVTQLSLALRRSQLLGLEFPVQPKSIANPLGPPGGVGSTLTAAAGVASTPAVSSGKCSYTSFQDCLQKSPAKCLCIQPMRYETTDKFCSKCGCAF